jgi:hypothetical protein
VLTKLVSTGTGGDEKRKPISAPSIQNGALVVLGAGSRLALLHTDYQQLGLIPVGPCCHYDTLFASPCFSKLSRGISSYLTSSQKGFNSKWQLSFLEPD